MIDQLKRDKNMVWVWIYDSDQTQFVVGLSQVITLQNTHEYRNERRHLHAFTQNNKQGFPLFAALELFLAQSK